MSTRDERMLVLLKPDTLRRGLCGGDFAADSIPLSNAEDRGLDSLVHAADSVAAARREIQIWFP